MDEAGVEAFINSHGTTLDNVRWGKIEAGARAKALASRATNPMDLAFCSWEDIDDGPDEDDSSWRAFDPPEADDSSPERKVNTYHGKKLTKAQREKVRDEEQMREARESIRKRGWTENEVKWRSWLARRGHDVMVHDWNLKSYIDGECIPPSRDPFWLNSNENMMPDYDAGNDGENEDPEPVLTNLMGETIQSKYAAPRQRVLKPLWHDIDGDQLVKDALGRLSETFYWRQTTSMVYIEFKIPEGTSARDLRVEMHPTRLVVTLGHDERLLDAELNMRIYVGSNADDNSSIWELQDKRCIVFHLVKWHRLEAGNVRDQSRTWWNRAFATEEPFENDAPTGAYYEAKERR